MAQTTSAVDVRTSEPQSHRFADPSTGKVSDSRTSKDEMLCDSDATPTLWWTEARHAAPVSSTSDLQVKHLPGPRRIDNASSPTPLVRSYSSMDAENDAFTGIHELDLDDWFSRVLAGIHLLITSFVVLLGLYLLICCPDMQQLAPLLFYFIIFSLSAEVLLLIVMCSTLLLLQFTCGEENAIYSSAMCGIFHKVMEGAIYFACVGVGTYILIFMAEIGGDTIQSAYIKTHEVALSLFVSAEVLLSLIYCLQTIPTLYGVCKFAFARIYSKFTGEDELGFQQAGNPLAYARLDDYERSLQHMSNPVLRAALRRQRQYPVSEGAQTHVPRDLKEQQTAPLRDTGDAPFLKSPMHT